MTINETGIFSKVRKCNESFYCLFDTTFDEEGFCVPMPNNTMYPGEYCAKNDDCYSNNCVENLCRGNSTGQECVGDVDCAVGLYCSNKLCTAAAASGMACSSSVKCQADSICVNNVCVKIGSLAENTNATIPATCATFYIRNGACAKGPKLDASAIDPNICNTPGISTPCRYSFESDPSPFNETCYCGMTANNTGLCKKGEGDIAINNVNLLNNLVVC
jgi:hypothetical protein